MGFVFGVLFAFGAFAFLKMGMRHRGGWHHHGGWHQHGGWRDGWDRHHHRRPWRDGAVRAAGEFVKRRLKVDEDQEGIVDLALADLRKAISTLGEALRDSRSEIAEAFRGDRVDDAALDAIFARQDEEVARARREAVSALRQIHAVLDPEQRESAVAWLGAASGGAARDLRYV
jgi:Spy/CpxP family protein refolding chaperone